MTGGAAPATGADTAPHWAPGCWPRDPPGMPVDQTKRFNKSVQVTEHVCQSNKSYIQIECK